MRNAKSELDDEMSKKAPISLAFTSSAALAESEDLSATFVASDSE
jgi:hypothetical protein